MAITDIDLSGLIQYCDPQNPISFNQNTDLGRISQRIMERCTMQGMNTSPEAIRNEVAKQFAEMQQDRFYQPIFAELETMATKLAQQFHATKMILKDNLAKEVAALAEQVNLSIAEYLKSLGADSLIRQENELQAQYEFNTMDWASVLTTDTNLLLDTMRGDNAPAFADGFGIHNLQAALYRTTNTITSMELPAETKSLLATQIEAAMGGTVVPGEAAGMNELLLDNDQYQRWLTRIVSAPASTSIVQTCLFYASLIKQLRPFLEAVNPARTDLSEESKLTYQNNLDAMQSVMRYLQFFLHTYRPMMAKSVILDTTTLNGDTLSEFTGSGGTMSDIVNHLKVNHLIPKMSIPQYGISGEFILAGKATILAELTEREAGLQRNKTYLYNEAMSRAFLQTTMTYLQQVDESLIPEHQNRAQFITEKQHLASTAQRTMLQKEGNLEDALYFFLIRCWYPKTIVATVYELYASTSASMLDGLEGETAALDIAELDARVGSQILTKFLMDTYLQKK